MQYQITSNSNFSNQKASCFSLKYTQLQALKVEFGKQIFSEDPLCTTSCKSASWPIWAPYFLFSSCQHCSFFHSKDFYGTAWPCKLLAIRRGARLSFQSMAHRENSSGLYFKVPPQWKNKGRKWYHGQFQGGGPSCRPQSQGDWRHWGGAGVQL